MCLPRREVCLCCRRRDRAELNRIRRDWTVAGPVAGKTGESGSARFRATGLGGKAITFAAKFGQDCLPGSASRRHSENGPRTRIGHDSRSEEDHHG